MSMDGPSSARLLASVVIPTFGRPRQVRECLESLADQTMGREEFEVIVVDDGGPEPLDAVVAEFESRLQIRLFKQRNAGPGAARNQGIRQARAPLVAFTDDDCRPQSTWLAFLVAAEATYPGSLIGGTTVNGLPDDVFAATSQFVVDLVYEHFNVDPCNAYFVTSNNMLCPRDRVLSLGGFDTTFAFAGGEDREFCDRWRMKRFRIVWRPEARVEHRHALSLVRFVEVYFRYGRGAYLYQATRRARGSGTMRHDLGFHMSLPRRIWRGLGGTTGPWRGACMGMTLLLWQAANAAGFFVEWIRDRMRSYAHALSLQPGSDEAGARGGNPVACDHVISRDVPRESRP